MQILHLDLPRALTTTIKPFDFEAAKYLEGNNISYDSIDINIVFWQFLFKQAGSQLNLETHLFAPKINASNILELEKTIDGINTNIDLPISIFGFTFDENIVLSTLNIRKFCNNFFHLKIFAIIELFIDEKLKNILFDNELPQVITLGIDSHQSLTFAALFAQAIKKIISPNIKIGIGKHSYENFSLSFWEKDREVNENLHSIFDFVIYHEEYHKENLVEIFIKLNAETHITQPKTIESLNAEETISERIEKYTELINKSNYQNFWAINPEKLVYFMPLSRNKCYWKKCTFCVQINKHVSDSFYSEDSEKLINLTALKILYQQGIRHIIFNDEAAIPKNIENLCIFLEQEKMSDLKWSVRIIANKNFQPLLIKRMRDNGCTEVLFGLETIFPTTAQSMGKVSSQTSESQIISLLENFSSQKIGIFLNFIYAFPTESEADFKKSYDFYQRIKNQIPGITVQFNKFALFYGSQIFNFPEEYNIKIVPSAPNHDITLIFDYVDRFGRQFSDAPNEEYFLESLEMNQKNLDVINDNSGFYSILFQLNYASFGFIYKCKTNYNLMNYVMSN